jgi:hypothetical protein
VSLELAGDRRYGERRERKPALGIEAVDRLQQAEARDLEEIVEGRLTALVTMREPPCERQVPLDQEIAVRRVAMLGVAREERAVSAGVGLRRIRSYEQQGKGHLRKAGHGRGSVPLPRRQIDPWRKTDRSFSC